MSTKADIRFSDRAELYQKYRPSYPDEAIDYIINHFQLQQGDSIADVGSGTGISARLFLDKGLQVFAVEPNVAMRLEAENELSHFSGFHSIAAHAENTSLPDKSVKAVIAAQAFHWFHRPEFKMEAERLMNKDFNLALIWNNRDVSFPFQQAYEKFLLEFSIDYEKVNHLNVSPSEIQDFFSPYPLLEVSFPYQQAFDLPGLIGRAASSSYLPGPGHERYMHMTEALRELFIQFQQNGMIIFAYQTKIFLTNHTLTKS